MYRLLILVAFVATSCAQTYVANSRNVPMFAEGGEFAGTVALASGVDVQAAYSVTDHVAVMANASILSQSATTKDGESFTRKNMFGEGGIGYFGRTKTMRYEMYAGYGMGERRSYEAFYFFRTTEAVIADGRYSRIFVQPSIATNKRKFNVAFSTRLSMVKFSEFTTTDASVAIKSQKPTDSPSFFIEPAVTTRFHLTGNLRGFFQIGLTTPMSGAAYFEHVPLQGAVGIQIHTGQLKTRVY